MGRLLIEFTTPMPLERVQRENPGVLLGGRYTPPDCTPAQTVAVIIPFRHREHHLRYWLHYLHPILRRQRLRYGIYVINQVRCLWPPGWTLATREPMSCCGCGGLCACWCTREVGGICLWLWGYVNVRAGVHVCQYVHRKVCVCEGE